MNAIAQGILSFCLLGFALGVILNFRYVLTIPFSMPRGTKALSYSWFILLAGLAVWFGRAEDSLGISSVDVSAMIQIASIFVALTFFLLFYGNQFRVHNMRGVFTLIFIYALIGFLLSPISEIFLLSMFKAFSLLASTIIAVAGLQILRKKDCPELLLNITYAYFTIILLTSALAGLFFPELTHRESKGVFGFLLVGWPHLNSNSLSFIAAVVLVVGMRRFFDPYYRRHRTLFLGLFFLGLGVLLLAQGRTSIGAAAVALLFLSFTLRNMSSVRWILLLSIFALIAIFMVTGNIGDWFGVTGEYLRRGVSDQDLATLSGRTEAWRIVLEMFYQSPVYGYGFYAAGKIAVAPHNAYLTVILQVGLLGFIPWFVAIGRWVFAIIRLHLRTNWRAPYSRDKGLLAEVAAVSFIQFVRTITGQDITIHSYSMMLFFSVSIFLTIYKSRLALVSRQN